ncbi:MAG TPA: cytochrome c biogenesis protein CcsA [Pyrinomonadaceae bacterium]|jgi:ABC-type transport system involved in cytochrome c biogenesis permease subunit
MSEVLKSPADFRAPRMDAGAWSLRSYLPAALPLLGAALMLLARIQFGGAHFIDDGALMMLALACYLTAATFHLLNLYAPSGLAQRAGLWLGSLGLFFNLSSWLVRWVAARDREIDIFLRQGKSLAELPWFFRYIPFANLYDLSLAFAFGAGLTTMLIAGRRNYRFLGAVSLPLAALILVLARFIGNEFINLPPVLDSYWRPIHVGIASLSYGIALVCFAAAVIYLLKDGVKPQAMAIWAGVFVIAVAGTVGGRFGTFPVFLTGNYAASTFIQGSRMALPLRVNIPGVGPLLIAASLALVGMIYFFLRYLYQRDEGARVWGQRLLLTAFALQLAAVVALAVQVKTASALGPCPAGGSFTQKCYDTRQYEGFGGWLAGQRGATPQQVRAAGPTVLAAETEAFLQENGSRLTLSTNANPVELSALITALAATFFVILFSYKTETLRVALPPAEKLDSLMYKTASVAFAGLAMLLITGAIWANESWGRYWGWDSKETGAFVAWLTYGGFLHARISRGLKGRRAAYFAVVAFLLVIFTYLGVSYLLPGLHSYA